MSTRETFFVDTNVILRFLLNDHAEQSPAAVDFFARFVASEYDLAITDSVIFEAVYVMQGSTYRVDRVDIADKLGRLLATDGIQVIGVIDFEEAFNLYTRMPTLSFADCAHAVTAMTMPNRTIVSFDREYQRVDGLVRKEPAAAGRQ